MTRLPVHSSLPRRHCDQLAHMVGQRIPFMEDSGRAPKSWTYNEPMKVLFVTDRDTVCGLMHQPGPAETPGEEN